MKFLGFTTILQVVVMALLMVSVAVQVYIMWTISGAKKYTLGGSGANRTVTEEGVEAAKYWKDKKIWMIAPTVGNVLGMALLGLMMAMS